MKLILVQFLRYCSTCRYSNEEMDGKHCEQCLNCTERIDTDKPLRYKKIKK